MRVLCIRSNIYYNGLSEVAQMYVYIEQIARGKTEFNIYFRFKVFSFNFRLQGIPLSRARGCISFFCGRVSNCNIEKLASSHSWQFIYKNRIWFDFFPPTHIDSTCHINEDKSQLLYWLWPLQNQFFIYFVRKCQIF